MISFVLLSTFRNFAAKSYKHKQIKMNIKYFLLTAFVGLCSFSACGDDDDEPSVPNKPEIVETPDTTSTQPKDTTTVQPTQPDTPLSESRYVGGDISMLTQYEAQKAQYFDRDGKAINNLITFLKEQGWNTMRVRLFVDPSKDSDKGVCQDLEYVKKLGKRIKDAGLSLLLDFHYSDTWADPAKQWTPAAWAQLSDAQLSEQLYNYTKDCLSQLNAAGATPDFIQTGNEISYGMLWGTEQAAASNNNNRCYTNSSAANWNRFIGFLKQAGKACREVCPKAKIIIHSERTPKPSILTDFFDRMKSAELDYDIIGLSYYPYFHGSLDALETAITQLKAKNYGKQIQIVETGYPTVWEMPGTTYDYTPVYPYTAEGQRNYTAALVTLLKKYNIVNGLSWWYPEANAYGATGNLKDGWYNAGLFDNKTGRALPALYELNNFQ